MEYKTSGVCEMRTELKQLALSLNENKLLLL